MPDGFTTPFAVFDTTDGVEISGFKSYSRNSNGVMATISNLGGVEKGMNTISMFTKGFAGDSIRLVVSFPESGQASQTIMFAANTTNWTEQSRSILIPTNCSRINLSFNLNKRTIPGFVKISGMKMFASQNLRSQTKNKNYFIDQENIGLKSNVKDLMNLKIFPNPMRDELHIQLQNSELISSIGVFDLGGKSKLHITHIFSKEYQLNTTDFVQGLYVLEVRLVNGEISRQILLK